LLSSYLRQKITKRDGGGKADDDGKRDATWAAGALRSKYLVGRGEAELNSSLPTIVLRLLQNVAVVHLNKYRVQVVCQYGSRHT
jgi:hypothetical protein